MIFKIRNPVARFFAGLGMLAATVAALVLIPYWVGCLHYSWFAPDVSVKAMSASVEGRLDLWLTGLLFYVILPVVVGVVAYGMGKYFFDQ